MPLAEVFQQVLPILISFPPFSFEYDGRPSAELMPAWRVETHSEPISPDRQQVTTTWRDPDTGLLVRLTATRFTDFPALDWVLHFENAGSGDLPILANIQAADVLMRAPVAPSSGPASLPAAGPQAVGRGPYRLHRTNGAPADATDFEPAVIALDPQHPATLSAGGGRSSNRDFPFFKIEAGRASLVVAVGWSGQWAARLACPDDKRLRLTAGMELTHFRLRPGETARSPRILMLYCDGDTHEANALFRQLIYKHYTATRGGQKLLPTPFCNTCFTRGGGWLNECNAQNQISLIDAYAKLGLEALWTDAGWFEGGWPAGAGNWTPRKDAYPDGMRPVAAAAQARGMIYGLWFEPERVVAGTWLQQNRPAWLLTAGDGSQDTYLLNFGLREVQDYFFNIVRGFMELPGFRVYRQDFNLDPLPYWRHNDPPDRQGLTEIRYIEGLYAYWDRIAATWPDSLREECASGGRRIDLETIQRMHIHQKSDYWFDNEVDQASIWGLSEYLPNNTFMTPLNRLDDYSFHSALATSLCLGWIADAPDFDAARGKALLDRYKTVRHLLIGAWYPLLPYSRDREQWMAVQYHRPDLDEGLILLFRRADSPQPAVELSLRGLQAEAAYELLSDRTGQTRHARGNELTASFEVELREAPSSDMLVYRRVR